MSTIRRLSLSLGADVGDFRSGLSDAADVADALDRRLAETTDHADSFARSMSNAGDAAKGMKGGNVGEIQAPGMGSLGGLGTQLRVALIQALGPLKEFGSQFQASFDRLGGTFVTLAKRIDLTLKQMSGFAESQLARMAKGFRTLTGAGIIAANKIAGAFVAPWLAVPILLAEYAFYKMFSKVADIANRTASRISGYFLKMGSVTKNGLKDIGLGVGGIAKGAAKLTGVAPVAKAASGALGSLKMVMLGAAGAATVLGAAGVFLLNGIKGATSLAETVSKVDVVFGESAKGVHAQAAQMARDFGLPKQPLLDAASAIGLMGKAAGQNQAQAASMGNSLSGLAADAASFYHVPLEEALGKIQSGLAGQSEPLRAFGVLINEDAVGMEAMRLGLSKTGKDMSEGAKVMARSSLITKGLKDATGDLARTQDSTANRFNKLTGGISNLANEIGMSMLPAVDVVLGGLNVFTANVSAWVERNKASFDAAGQFFGRAVKVFGEGIAALWGWLQGVPAAFDKAFGGEPRRILDSFVKAFVDGVEAVGFAWRNLPDILAIAFIRFREGFINMGEWMGVLPQNLQIIGNYIANNWTKLIADSVKYVITVFQNLWANLKAVSAAIGTWLADPTQGFKVDWTPLLDGFKATADKLPEMIRPGLTSLQSEVDAKLESIGKRELDRAKRLADEAKNELSKAAKVVPGAPLLDVEKKAAKKKERMFAGGSELGSKEAYSQIVMATGRTNGADAIARDQLGEQRRANQLILNQTAAVVAAITRAGAGAPFSL